MKLVCPECKNDVDMSKAPTVEVDHVIECNHCGITLQVTEVKDDALNVEIVDEGK